MEVRSDEFRKRVVSQGSTATLIRNHIESLYLYAFSGAPPGQQPSALPVYTQPECRCDSSSPVPIIVS